MLTVAVTSKKTVPMSCCKSLSAPVLLDNKISDKVYCKECSCSAFPMIRRKRCHCYFTVACDIFKGACKGEWSKALDYKVARMDDLTLD